MSKVIDIFPADKFQVVADAAKDNIEFGLIIGWDHNGDLGVYAGGSDGGRRPVAKDWLWLVEAFKLRLIDGEYHDE